MCKSTRNKGIVTISLLPFWQSITKGGFKSEDVEGFSNLQTHMPNYYLKLLHPVHSNDKILIQFDILQVKNKIIMKINSKIQLMVHTFNMKNASKIQDY
jgi:hypothetical protein